MALAALLPLGQAAEMKTPGDRMFAWYFENETKRLAKADLAEIRTLGDWNEKKNELPAHLQIWRNAKQHAKKFFLAQT